MEINFSSDDKQKSKASTNKKSKRNILKVLPIDHTKLDVSIIDESSKFHIASPWVTMILHEETNWILHYYIGLAPYQSDGSGS